MFRIRLLWIGKPRERYVEDGVSLYLRKLRPYAPVECEELRSSRSSTPERRMREETELLLSKLDLGQPCVVLDERGKRQTSLEFSHWLEAQLPLGWSRLTFVVGGSHGMVRELFPNEIQWLRISDLTLNHQMVRLVLLEQIYRAFTILRGEPYHH